MRFFLGSILPYAAWAVFLVGMAWRTASWLRRPVPVSLSLLPGPCGPGRRAWELAAELLGFRSLWRGERGLWLAAWLMHAALALVIVGHVVGIAALGGQFCWLGATPETSAALSHWFGIASGIALAVTLVVLGVRRARTAELRRLSTFSDYFALGLLLAVAGSGMALRLVRQPVEPAQVRNYLAGLLAFPPGELPGGPLLAAHLTLVHVLLIYFPFSKLVHLTGGVVSRMLVAGPAPIYPTPREKEDGPHLPERPGGCFAQMGTVPFFPESRKFTQEAHRP